MEAFEIITYGGGEFLRIIFNGIVMIMGDNNFTTLMRIFMLVGFLWVLGGAAFNTKVLPSFTWLLGALAVVYLMLIPKVNVMVIDRLDPSVNSVVANVPVGVGVTASFVSKVGDYLTRSYETVFAMPDDIKYSKNGLLFGQRLVEANSRVKVLDGRTLSNFQEFFNNCVLYDANMGLYSWSDLQETDNLIGFLGQNTSIIRRYYHRYETGSSDLLVCRDAIREGGHLYTDLTAAVVDAERRLGIQMFGKRTSSIDEAVSQLRILNASNHQYLANISQSSADLMRQNIMINATRDAAQGAAMSSDATAAAISYAVARAEAERKVTWQTMGEMALRTLPLLRNIFEALMYAVFPLVLLMALVAPKQAVMGYAKSLIWVQLWAPLYAVLHSAMSLYSGYAAQGAMGATPGITLLTSPGLAEAMADTGYIAGYLAVSIPMMAYMLVSQGGMMMASMAGGVMQGMQGIAARAADEATTGNISLGQNSQDNINWFKNDRSVMDSSGTGVIGDSSGNIYSIGEHGTQLQNNPISANLSGAVSSNVNTQSGTSLNAALSNVNEHGQQTQAAYQDMVGVNNMLSKGAGMGHSFNQQDSAKYSQGMSEMKQIANDFANKFGYTEEEGMTAALSLRAAASGGFQAFGNGIKTELAGELRAHTNATSNEGVEEQIKWLEQQNFNEAFETARTAAHNLTADFSNRTDDSWAHNASNTFSQVEQTAEKTIASMQTANTWAELKSHLDSNSANVGLDASEAVHKHLQDALGFNQTKELVAKARDGDVEAMSTLNSHVNDWVRSQSVQDLAQIIGAPDKSGVEQQQTANKSGMPNTEDLLNKHNAATAKDKQTLADGRDLVVTQAGNIAGNTTAEIAGMDTHLVNAKAQLLKQGAHLTTNVRNDLGDGGTWGGKGEHLLKNNPVVGGAREALDAADYQTGKLTSNPVTKMKLQGDHLDRVESKQGGRNTMQDLNHNSGAESIKTDPSLTNRSLDTPIAMVEPANKSGMPTTADGRDLVVTQAGNTAGNTTAEIAGMDTQVVTQAGNTAGNTTAEIAGMDTHLVNAEAQLLKQGAHSSNPVTKVELQGDHLDRVESKQGGRNTMQDLNHNSGAESIKTDPSLTNRSLDTPIAMVEPKQDLAQITGAPDKNGAPDKSGI